LILERNIILKINLQDKTFSVNEKIIAIIGATGFLGTEYVKYLSSLGATIVIGDIDIDKCNNLSDQLNDKGYNTFAIKIDNTDEKSIRDFFVNIKNKFNCLDVLINNAQIKPKGFFSKFEDYRKDTLIDVIDCNLIGVTLSCKEAAKIFTKQENGGVIVNVSSIYGIIAPDQRIYKNAKNLDDPGENLSTPVSYAISKAGVVQLTKYLASYFREQNIRINCLTPGGAYNDHDDNFNKLYSSRTTIGRMAKKTDYNGAMLFLCSDASSYMNGSNLIIDGGWTVI